MDQKSKGIVEKRMGVIKKGTGMKIATLDDQSEKSASKKIDVPFLLVLGLEKCSGCKKEKHVVYRYFFGNNRMCNCCLMWEMISYDSGSSSSSSDSSDSKDEGGKKQNMVTKRQNNQKQKLDGM